MLAAFFSITVGAGIRGRNGRQQFDERRTSVTELGLSTRIRLRRTLWSRSGWPRKPMIVRLELMWFGMARDRQRNCHLFARGLITLAYGPTFLSPSSHIFKERMAKTCRKRPGNPTRNTDG